MKKIYIVGVSIPFDSKAERVTFYNSIFREGSSAYVANVYGWTQDYKLFKKFIDTHKKKFLHTKSIKLDKDSYEDFYKFYKDLEIKYISYNASYSHSVSILSTPYEKKMCQISEDDYIETYACEIVGTDYEMFKEKYIDALDYLSYTTFYDIYVNYEERNENGELFTTDRNEVATYNQSFNMTVYGNPLNLLTDSELIYYWNIFNGFIDTDYIDELIQ